MPFLVDGEISGIPADDIILSKDIADTLNRHYPDHPWMVNVNSKGGVAYIFNGLISHRYGFVLHLKDLYQDPERRLVIRAGGEMLERAAMKRGRATGETAQVLQDIPKFIPGIT